MAESAEFAAVALELMSEFGSSLTYTQDAITRNAATGDITSRTPTTTSVTAYLFQDEARYEAPELTVDVIQMGYMLPVIGLTPAIGDRITDPSGRDCKVVKLGSHDVNGVPIVYLLWLGKN